MATVTQLQRTSPEAVGIPSTAILDFIEAIEQHDHPLRALHGFMLLRHGKVAAEGWWEPYAPDLPHSLYSLSKSFTSTAIGLAVDEGLLSVDDPVLRFFPDDAPENPSDNLQAMRVRHLLSMNTGHHEDTTGDVFRGGSDNWPRTFLSLPVEHEPGTWFVYNTGATYMISAIITRLTGMTLLDYLRPRIFEPLGIENPTWETDPQGISLGGTGLHITTEGIARFGQLYLQKGQWQGQSLVPEDWIDEATRAHSDNSNTQSNPDWTVGYGYQFWRCRHNCYRGDGAFGQYCVVMPEQNAVLAINSGLLDMQSILDKVWEHLLPAMRSEALPTDSQAEDRLRDKLASLSLPVPSGSAASPAATQRSGKEYELEPNELRIERVTLTFGDDRSTVDVLDACGEHSFQAGHGTWLKGTSDLRGQGEEPVAASGAWTADDTFEIRICFTESEVCQVIRLHYEDDQLRLEAEPNVSWGAPAITSIAGRVSQ